MVDIDEIYDAAFDRELFTPLLRKILAGMGAQCGFLGWVDMESQARFEVQHGNDPAYLQSYAETYAAHDILQPTLRAAAEGEVMQAYALLATPEVRESLFYREWLAPQRIVDNLAVNLIKRDQMFAPMAIIRTGDAPPFDDADIARLKAVAPHLRRAVYMQSRLIHQANLVRGYQRITSGARNGLILLDDQQYVLDIDRMTQALTGLRAGQSVSGGGAFEKALAAVLGGEGPTAVELSGEPPAKLLCVAQPLERDPFGDFAGGQGVAHAVHVSRLDEGSPIAFGSMAQFYGLTPTERNVMSDAFANSDITRVGERLGMAAATARTHLHRIYEKTGVQGFPGLCLLAHRFALPA